MELNNVKLNSSFSGFPQAKTVTCSKCRVNKFLVKFVISKQDYSKKNNWGFWTEKSENKNQEWCNSCLRQIYYDKESYWQAVQNSKKRALFRVYLSNNHI